VIVDDGAPERLVQIRRALALIGLDRFAGYFTSNWISRTIGRATIPQITSDELAARLSANGLVVLDVRNQNEWDEGHLPQAIHIPLGHLSDRLAEVPRDKPIVVHCQAGARSAIAASLMEKLGRKGVTNLVGGYDAWEKN
jgi:hydroxyacylglutathione hydrolase